MSEGEHPYVERLEKEMACERRYVTEAEEKAFWEGWRAAGLGIAETEQVRKIACAFIASGEANPWTVEIIADVAWKTWRAIKAGQEGKS